MIASSLRHGFSNLLNFRGRTSRALFWPYALLLFALTIVAWFAVFVPELGSTMARMQRFAAEHPDQATITQGPGSYSISIEGNHPEFAPDFAYLMTAIGTILAVFVLSIAAAVIRRLRDAGRTGWWAVPPVMLLTIGSVVGRNLFVTSDDAAAPELGVFALLFVNNLLYLASLGLLVVQLARSGKADVA